MAKNAKPFQKNGAWAYRATIGGIRQFHGDFATEALAVADRDRRLAEYTVFDTPEGDGPDLTTLATALTNYALQTLPKKKSARQEIDRINRYQRAVNRPTLKASKHAAEPSLKARMRESTTPDLVIFKITQQPPTAARKVPRSLHIHRETLAKESAKTDYLRKTLAQTKMSEVSYGQLQTFVFTMVQEGYSASSVHKEVAILRQLFNHARTAWKWAKLALNPTKDLKLPELDNGRDRILTELEWNKLVEPLARYDNPYALPLVCLMLESAMRSCEPLTLMTWDDIDWDNRILRLPDGKSGKRDVPLGPGALLILSQMRARLPEAKPEDLVFPTTYEALKKAWREACKDAGITGVKPHDLRHTSATRYCLEFNGNLPVLKLITGHKTTKMVERYVNLNATQVATLSEWRHLALTRTHFPRPPVAV